MIKKNTLVVPISDLHSGGSTALFPKRFWQFKHVNHTPTKEQKDMFDHWARCAAAVKKAREGKRLIVVHDGDAIEGAHHGSLQIITALENEQIEIHCDLMDYFLQAVGFGRGDELYYVPGTEVHTNDGESQIGKDLGAIPSGEDLYAWDELKLDINGKRIWFLHHGPGRGRGANRGNPMRNWLKNVFFDCVSEGLLPPHYIVTGHVHDPDWGNYIGRLDGKYHMLQGLICPSWQRKTRYGYKVAPTQLNKIGLQYFEITKDGLISDPVELLMK